jgi:UDP-N-acetylglucosamine acyltransferase
LQRLQRAYRYLLAAKLNTTQALEKMRTLEGEDVALLVRFIERSERGVIK